ncbi:hypothetical protein FKM82_009312 [Ascaphus truei]
MCMQFGSVAVFCLFKIRNCKRRFLLLQGCGTTWNLATLECTSLCFSTYLVCKLVTLPEYKACIFIHNITKELSIISFIKIRITNPAYHRCRSKRHVTPLPSANRRGAPATCFTIS